VEKDGKFLLSIIISAIFALSGIIGTFFMQNSMKNRIPEQVSKLDDINNKEEKVLKSRIYVNGGMSKEEAANLVSYFYDSVNSKDYVTAYALLGEKCQKKTNYNNFKQRCLDTVSVKVDNIISGDLEGGCYEVIAVIDTVEKDGNKTKNSKYKTTCTVAFENRELKIINGEFKML
jgi:hypothetical protein